MNLLYEIKLFYDKIVEYGLLDKKPEFGEIDNVAERCYHKNYKDLTKYISKDLEAGKADDLNNRIEKIKEIIRNDKKGK